ncbi:alpha/beta hydrolase family protein [Alteromonas sp. ASW11-19]|uniref:Alpha/beta hydrolase family protein n=1 Tax=Alteromonas salexigens TaxID=2982530 RepID=A0ABT2VIP6_9ALTE|nr:alpha/beta hydrolase family protein [Alteromonas salexigens]MCU7553012.1 alpha/beta hydrolase family protein [Alteromonas salexigens]
MNRRLTQLAGALALILTALANTAGASVRAADVARQFFPGEYQTVLAGEQTVPVLFSEASLPLVRGVIIILVEEGTQNLNLASARELAFALNTKGWHTLVSPSLLVTGAPATQTTETTGETATQPHPMSASVTPAVNYAASQAQLLQLMTALNNYLTSYKGYRLVVASGMTAAQLLALSASDTLAPPDSMITIAPFWPQREYNHELPGLMAQTGFPLLDISTSMANPWQRDTATKRRNAARTALKLQYRQRQLQAVNTASADGRSANAPFVNWLSGEIYGWISYLGW